MAFISRRALVILAVVLSSVSLSACETWNNWTDGDPNTLTSAD